MHLRRSRLHLAVLGDVAMGKAVRMSVRVKRLLRDLAEGARDLGLRDLASDLDAFASAEGARTRGVDGKWTVPSDDEPAIRRILRAVDTRS